MNKSKQLQRSTNSNLSDEHITEYVRKYYFYPPLHPSMEVKLGGQSEGRVYWLILKWTAPIYEDRKGAYSVRFHDLTRSDLIKGRNRTGFNTLKSAETYAKKLCAAEIEYWESLTYEQKNKENQ